MVKRLVRFSFPVFLFIFCLLPLTVAFAGSFEASVDRTSVYKGESFVLNLTLSNAQAKGAPDLAALEKDFYVVSRAQTSSVNIINGSYSAKTGWRLTVVPKRMGKFQIPAISIMTDGGAIQSSPVQIEVLEDSPSKTDQHDGRDVYVTGEVSSNAPTLNTPVVYTVRLVASRPVFEISHGDLKIEDTIVEKQGDAKVYDSVRNGKKVKIVELRYLITPLKAGTLTIPAFTFQGMINTDGGQMLSPFGSPFGGRGHADPFDMLQNLGVFADIMGQPFTLMTDEVRIDVQDAQAKIDPWLPAERLEISDTLEGEANAKAGEPMTRRLTLAVKGNTGNILPSLEAQAAQPEDFSVYSDQPETGFSISADGKSVSGWREEVYTLVPKHGGDLVLPEIKVAWWDVLNQKVAFAVVPARTVRVSGEPAKAVSVPPVMPSVSEAQNAAPDSSAEKEPGVPAESRSVKWPDDFILVALALGSLVIVAGISLLVISKRQMLAADKGPAAANEPEGQLEIISPANQNTKQQEEPVQISDIRAAEDLDALKTLLLLFMRQKSGASAALSLKDAAQVLSNGLDRIEQERLAAAVSRLEAVLYAGRTEPFESLRGEIAGALESFKPCQDRQGGKPDRLGALNPS